MFMYVFDMPIDGGSAVLQREKEKNRERVSREARWQRGPTPIIHKTSIPSIK